MKKALVALLIVAVATTPALAQVRPENCVPIFPLLDEVAVAQLPQDLTVAQAAPTAAVKRGFFGLPFLLPLLLAAGGAGAFALGGDGGDNATVSPA